MQSTHERCRSDRMNKSLQDRGSVFDLKSTIKTHRSDKLNEVWLIIRHIAYPSGISRSHWILKPMLTVTVRRLKSTRLDGTSHVNFL